MKNKPNVNLGNYPATIYAKSTYRRKELERTETHTKNKANRPKPDRRLPSFFGEDDGYGLEEYEEV